MIGPPSPPSWLARGCSVGSAPHSLAPPSVPVLPSVLLPSVPVLPSPFVVPSFVVVASSSGWLGKPLPPPLEEHAARSAVPSPTTKPPMTPQAREFRFIEYLPFVSSFAALPAARRKKPRFYRHVNPS